MTFEILAVDPWDDDAVRGWNRAYELADGADRGAAADTWTLQEAQLELQQESDVMRRLPFAGVVDGSIVASLWLALPLKTNLHLARFAIHVHPDHRRRGYGARLLDHVERLAREAGRTTLVTNAHFPYELGPDGTGSASVAFAVGHGYALALGDVQRRLDLPVAEARLAALAADVAPHHTDYTLRCFTGPIPDDMVAGWAALDAVLEVDAPSGDLDIEAASGDVADVREQEALSMGQGRTFFNAVAMSDTGEVAAYTQLAVPRSEPRAYQWGTLVRRDHRGHRLGTALKVANLRLLQRERPDIQHVRTYNAEVNSHMTAVNELLGFMPVERLGEFQKRLA